VPLPSAAATPVDSPAPAAALPPGGCRPGSRRPISPMTVSIAESPVGALMVLLVIAKQICFRFAGRPPFRQSEAIAVLSKSNAL